MTEAHPDSKPAITEEPHSELRSPLSLRRSLISVCVAQACRQIGHEWRAMQILNSWENRSTNPDLSDEMRKALA